MVDANSTENDLKHSVNSGPITSILWSMNDSSSDRGNSRSFQKRNTCKQGLATVDGSN